MSTVSQISQAMHVQHIQLAGGAPAKPLQTEWGRNRRQCCRRPCQASAIKTNDGVLSSVHASFARRFRLESPSTFAEYLTLLNSRLPNFELPLGASVAATSGSQVILTVRLHIHCLAIIRTPCILLL